MIATTKFISRWYSIPLLVLLWQVSVSAGLVQSRLLPAPELVFSVLVRELADGQLLWHSAITVARALQGFALASLIGIPFAAAMARSWWWRNLFEPVFFFGYPVPKIALYPVFTYVFGIGSPSKVAFIFLECLYPIVVTCYFGFRGIQTRLIWTARNLGASRATILRRVILPASLPNIFSGLRVALPIAIIIAVITEMIGGSDGLGYYITIWSTRFAFPNVYAAIVLIGLYGYTLDRLLLLMRGWIVYWQPASRNSL